jgi:hypothetical protein
VRSPTRLVPFLIVGCALVGQLPAQNPEPGIVNWPAPLYWSPGRGARVPVADTGDFRAKDADSVPTSTLPFVGITPCRLVDTRNSGFPPGYGPPSLSPGVPNGRTFIMTGQCGIGAGAEAVSLNVTVTGTLGTGYVVLYPQDGPFPPVSTLNYFAGQTVANSAIVPLGTGGAIRVVAGVSGTDLIIDVNGYYASNLTSTNGAFSITSSIDGGSNGAGVVVGHNKSASGENSWGGQFISDSCYLGAAGVFAEATSQTNCAAASYGVWGRSRQPFPGSAGVLGEAWGTLDFVFGVKGVTASATLDAAGVKGAGGWGDPLGDYNDCGPCYNAGVRGVNDDDYGVLGLSKQWGVGGVALKASDPTQSEASGYLGFNAGSGTYYGVYSAGNFGGSGAKYFVEPHPHDASKVIRYIALEGPEAGTYFRGTARTHGREAIIEVPESFRLVTEPDGITVQLTPIGDLVTLAVVSQDLNQIVVKSSGDVRFHYQVNGIRHGFGGFDPVATSSVFAPRKANEPIPAYLTEAEKRSLIANGTYNADGTVNLETAHALGWDRAWQSGPAQRGPQ